MSPMPKIMFRHPWGRVTCPTILLLLVLFAQLVPGNAPCALAYTALQPEEIRTMVENGTAGTIIDVREYNDYCSGHIPCALNYPWNSRYLQDYYSELDPHSRYIVVCLSGIRSASASAFLESQGFTEIYTMSGGMNAWPGARQTCSTKCPTLYFPHIATTTPWHTEIAVINTSDQAISGTLKAVSDAGKIVQIKTILLPPRGRKEIDVAVEFTNHTTIGYMVFTSNSAAVKGYTKFYIPGSYRAAIPAIQEVNTSDIHVSHIASNTDWWTGLSLVNTTSETKELTIAFNTGHSGNVTLNANEHRALNIAEAFFDNNPPADIRSAVIANANGIIGLELFGSLGWGTQLEGILLTDNTASTIFYPHVAWDPWWTGVVAFNPSASEGTITINPYRADGIPLAQSTLPIAAGGKYIGAVADLGLPADTAWFRLDSTQPLSGFELFGNTDGSQLGAYAGNGAGGAKSGVFAKIEEEGWTGIAFVNTEGATANVTLTAFTDDGAPVATQSLQVQGHAKVVDNPEQVFTQNIGTATYIAFASDRNVVGFQLNGSADGTMLDGLPGM